MHHPTPWVKKRPSTPGLVMSKPPSPPSLAELRKEIDAIDDVAALHEQAVHALIDGVDFLAQFGKRRRGRGL